MKRDSKPGRILAEINDKRFQKKYRHELQRDLLDSRTRSSANGNVKR